MVVSRGGVSGGLTIAEALGEFEARGYRGQFVARDGGIVECESCGASLRPRDVEVEETLRIEGASDPADMVYVGAMHCPECGAAGTATLHYGALAAPEEAAVLRDLDDRHAEALARRPHDDSMVSDSGWLKGPEG